MYNQKKRTTIVLSLFLSAVLFLGILSWESPSFAAEPESPAYAPGEIIVVFAEDINLEEAEIVIEEMGAEDADLLDKSDGQITELVTLPEEQSVDEAVEAYSNNPEVDYAQPNFRYTLIEQASPAGETPVVTNDSASPAGATPFSTNDKYYGRLWHFTNTSVEAAWDILNGVNHKKVKVAVLDTGLSLPHTDMQKNVNKTLCKDTSSGTSTVNLKGDLGSHGTHVSGIIAATTNNGKGVAGVATGKDNSAVSLFVVKVFKKEKGEEVAYTNAIVRGLNYAKGKGAKVINMSLGYATDRPKDKYDRLLESTCNAAVEKGITVVCAGGNDGQYSYWATKPNYPADFPACISVISSDQDDGKSFFSSYGAGKDISAPGYNIYSTIPGSSYRYMSGTSMASPVVAGIAALLYSANPNLTVDQVKNMLYTTAIDTYTPGWDQKSGWGVVDAEAALQKTLDETTKIKTITLPNITVGRENKATIKPAIKPASALDKTLTWESNNPSVAVVADIGKTGKVTGKSPALGSTVTITARARDADHATGTCTVTIGYGITYQLFGGKNHPENPTAYLQTENVTLKKPTRVGYIFKGWYLDSTYKEPINTPLQGTDYTVYAKWKKVTVGKTAIKSLKKPSQTKLKVSYKKVSGVAGYQIKYSLKKNFSGSKTLSTKKTFTTLKKLKAGKKYYIKVRAYKLDSAGKKVYGKYSTVKGK